MDLVHTGDGVPNGKRCELFPRFEKGGDSLADDVVFPCIALLFTHWAFLEEVSNEEAQPIFQRREGQ
jgi:hypothetical protein